MIASLWAVDDDATAELMKDFYEPIVKDKRGFAAALTDAKRRLAATKKWAHPFYWAPFVLIGA